MGDMGSGEHEAEHNSLGTPSCLRIHSQPARITGEFQLEKEGGKQNNQQKHLFSYGKISCLASCYSNQEQRMVTQRLYSRRRVKDTVWSKSGLRDLGTESHSGSAPSLPALSPHPVLPSLSPPRNTLVPGSAIQLRDQGTSITLRRPQ